MQFDGTCWRTTNLEDSVRICQEAAHPGITGDIAWRWASDMTGRVRVQVSASKKDIGGGDGVVILVYRNIDALATWNLAWNDSTGFSQTFDTDIVAGDLLFFVLKIGGTPVNDETAFRAQVYRQ